jgi:hypothetical protein
MKLRTILVDWPAKAFNAWWTAYTVLLTFLIMVVVTVMVIVIVLDQVFHVRWGW